MSAAVRRELTRAERDFLHEPRYAVLGTTNENGSAHLEDLARDPRASLMVPDGQRFVRVEGTVRADDDQQVAQADIRKLALRYRITYRMSVRHVYSSGV